MKIVFKAPGALIYQELRACGEWLYLTHLEPLENPLYCSALRANKRPAETYFKVKAGLFFHELLMHIEAHRAKVLTKKQY